MTTRVLIVDDHPKITTGPRRGLRYEGHDMATPDGIEVCRRLGAEDNAPIIMLTARDDVADKVAASNLEHFYRAKNAPPTAPCSDWPARTRSPSRTAQDLSVESELGRGTQSHRPPSVDVVTV
jgi:PleD family two-component response regulator